MNWARLARVVATAELPVIIAIAPALLFPTPARLLVLTAVPLLWSCARLAGDRFIPRTPMNAALGLMVAMVGVSLYTTFDIQFSLGKVSGVVLGVVLFLAIVRWMTTAGRLKVGTVAFLLAGAGLAGIGLLGVDAMGNEALVWVLGKVPVVIRGVPGAEKGFNPNAIAGGLVLFVPLQVALLASGLQRWPVPLSRNLWTDGLLIVSQVILLVLTAGTILLVDSRGALVGLVVAMFGLLVLRSRWACVTAAIAAGVALVLTVAFGPERVINQAITRAGPQAAANVAIRLELWSRGIEAVQDFPLTGMGMNTFRHAARAQYPVVLFTGDVAHAHNHLLQAALDLGIPGLIAYQAIWIIAGVLLTIVYRRSDERVLRAMAAGLGGGLLAHFIFGLIDAIPLGSKVGLLFWLTLALTVALHHVTQAPRSDTTTHPAPATSRQTDPAAADTAMVGNRAGNAATSPSEAEQSARSTLTPS